MKEIIEDLRARAHDLKMLNDEYDRTASSAPGSQEDADDAKKKCAELRKKIMKMTFEIKKTLQKAERKACQNA